MATSEEILVLRGMINDRDEPHEFSDDELSAIIDTSSSMDGAAYVVWVRKAAGFSTSVDVSESGTTRKMSDLYDNAMDQVKFFRSRVDAEVVVQSNAPFTVQAERA